MTSIFDILFNRSIPEDMRWTWGDAAHIIYMVLTLAGTVLFLRWVSGLDDARAEKVMRNLSIAVFFGWVIPPLLQVTTDTGERLINHLPLHLCSSACIIIPIALRTKNQVLLNYIYGLAFPGAIAAILTPGEMYRYLASVGAHYFLFNLTHWIIIVACLTPLVRGITQVEWRYYPSTVGIGLALMVVDFPLNKWLGTNFMFVNWAEPGTILETFQDLAGPFGYVLVLAAFGAVVVALLYLPGTRASRRHALALAVA
jgi:hypothetical integral membrane protein (TIGR02206 family)